VRRWGEGEARSIRTIRNGWRDELRERTVRSGVGRRFKGAIMGFVGRMTERAHPMTSANPGSLGTVETLLERTRTRR